MPAKRVFSLDAEGGATSPGYSIRVVASQTGIPVDTLRIWERRYGFPKPARRPGGGRLYHSSDIARLHLIARARDAGYRPGDVISLPDHDIERLVGDGNAAAQADEATPPTPPTAFDGAANAIENLLNQIRSDDVGLVRRSLRSLALTLGPTAFVTQIAHPLAVSIGLAWERGEIEVRHEHLASALLSMQLRLLLSTFDDEQRERAESPRVLLTTLPGEAHGLGLEMIAVYLAAHHRATPRLLGADTPTEEIARAAHGMKVDVVGISVSTAHEAHVMKAHVNDLRAALDRLGPIKLWVGGSGAPFVAEASANVTITTSWEAVDRAVAAASSSLASSSSSSTHRRA